MPLSPSYPSHDTLEQRVDRWAVTPHLDDIPSLFDVLPCLSDRASQLGVADQQLDSPSRTGLVPPEPRYAALGVGELGDFAGGEGGSAGGVPEDDGPSAARRFSIRLARRLTTSAWRG